MEHALSNTPNAEDIVYCPITTKPLSHHLHYHLHPVLEGSRSSFGRIPSPTKLCQLVIRTRQELSEHRFIGRFLKVAEYQETRVIVLIQHIQSPAIVSVAVAYEDFEGDTASWWGQVIWSIVNRIGFWRKPDSEDYLPGK